MSTKKKQYDLRSGRRRAVQIPVQLQFQTSEDHSAEATTSNGTMDQCQVSFSESDKSSINLDDFVNTVESDVDSDVSDRVFHKLQNNRECNTDLKVQTSQEAINQAILKQLSSIDKHLECIEQRNMCKKSVDSSKIKNKSLQVSNARRRTVQPTSQQKLKSAQSAQSVPALDTLRQDRFIQSQVDERLKELSNMAQGTDQKIKSQRGGPVDIFVKNRVKWPHEFVLSGPSKERVSYNNLTVLQWVTGFCRTMKEEKDLGVREHMLDYVISLLDDAQDFSWQAAKASHAVLLCRMEQGEISDWGQVDKIDRIRRANAQKHVTVPSNTQFTKSNASRLSNKAQKTMPCVYYNQGSCSQAKSHETKGIFYKHICSACFANDSKAFPHTEQECQNKLKTSKNEL